MGANRWLRSANAPLMMPNERPIKLNEAPFCSRKGVLMPNARLRKLNARLRKLDEARFS
jgi:hypothetical protein